MSETVKLEKKGQIIYSQARESIANIVKFMKEEAANGVSIIPLAATGFCENSYKPEADVKTGASTLLFLDLERVG
ncbi:hypothetical protein FQR65_LT00669 [Abscondita terminalis]|nr:hypothetical protein FQR65_LT00669 [Abscondita terminalis]